MGARFQVLFHSPPGVLFTFPSPYWFAIGHRVVLGLDGGPPRFRTVFPRARPYSGTASRRPVWVRVRGCHPLRPALPCRSAPQRTSPGGGSPRMRGPATLGGTPAGMPAQRFGHRSPFARRYSGSLEIDFLSSGYLDVSVPRVVLPTPYVFGVGICTLLCMGSPIGDPRSKDVCSSPGIIAACRVLHRLPVPRHPPCARGIFAGPHGRGISTCR